MAGAGAAALQARRLAAACANATAAAAAAAAARASGVAPPPPPPAPPGGAIAAAPSPCQGLAAFSGWGQPSEAAGSRSWPLPAGQRPAWRTEQGGERRHQRWPWRRRRQQQQQQEEEEGGHLLAVGWRASQLPWPGQRAHAKPFTSATSAAAVAPLQEQHPEPPPPPLAARPPRRPAAARVLDGRAVAAGWSEQLAAEVAPLAARLGRPPGLSVVMVGSRPDSLLYVSRKEEACARVGIACRVLRLPETVSQAQLCAAVGAAAAADAVDGVLVQLPLPAHLDEEAVMEALDPRKDVDGFHPVNMGRMLMRGRARRFVPATPLGIVELLSRSGVALAGKTAVVLGDSNIVGTPLAALLRDEGAALVTTCHRVGLQDWRDEQARRRLQRAHADACLPRLPGPGFRDEGAGERAAVWAAGSGDGGFQAAQLPAICRTADVLVVAVGSPELVRGSWIKPGAVVVDVGINVVAGAPGGGVEEGGSSAEGGGGVGCALRECQARQQQQQQWRQLERAGAQPASSFLVAQGSCPEPPQQALQRCAGEGAGAGGALRVVGDVAHGEAAAVASVVTPVPGGVGPMTIAALLHNTLLAARYRAGLLPW